MHPADHLRPGDPRHPVHPGRRRRRGRLTFS
jgi:hypothetical protein